MIRHAGRGQSPACGLFASPVGTSEATTLPLSGDTAMDDGASRARRIVAVAGTAGCCNNGSGRVGAPAAAPPPWAGGVVAAEGAEGGVRASSAAALIGTASAAIQVHFRACVEGIPMTRLADRLIDEALTRPAIVSEVFTARVEEEPPSTATVPD